MNRVGIRMPTVYANAQHGSHNTSFNPDARNDGARRLTLRYTDQVNG